MYFALLALFANSSFALEPTYGPEWEFGSWKLWHFPGLKHVSENGGVVPDEKHEKVAVEMIALKPPIVPAVMMFLILINSLSRMDIGLQSLPIA